MSSNETVSPSPFDPSTSSGEPKLRAGSQPPPAEAEGARRGKVDRARYEASVERLYNIFKDISATVGEVSSWRCPYKNVENRCTASFGCRNQDRSVPPGELYVCTGSDNLDYRNAWEIQ